MGRMIAVVLMVLLVMGSGPTHAQSDWSRVSGRLAAATVSVQSIVTADDGTQTRETTCSGFAISEQRNLFMTAYHCLGDVPSPTVDWQVAWVVYADYALDLAVLQSPGVKRPALRPRTALIMAGMPAASFGHAFGFEVPVIRGMLVSHPEMLIPPIKDMWPRYDANLMVFDSALIGGMSGGPIVDTDGNVIAINLVSNVVQAGGRHIDRILKATGAFWASPK